jgi:hypothetical protein
VPETQPHERPRSDSRDHRHATAIRLLPAEARLARTHAGSWLHDPELAGNPVAVAHARAQRESRPPAPGAGSSIGTALLFLIVLPTILFLVSNPLGWLLLLGLCFGFGYVFGFGGIL